MKEPVHRIRLSAAWEIEHQHASDNRPAGRIHLPFPDASVSLPTQPLILKRRFHRPTGLSTTSTVSLILIWEGHPVEPSLNSELLTEAKNTPQDAAADFRTTPTVANDDSTEPRQVVARYDVHSALRPYNEVRLTLPPSADGTIDSVLTSAWLSIDEAGSET